MKAKRLIHSSRFEAKETRGKRIPFVPIGTRIYPSPPFLREERLSQHANRCAMSGRILDAEQNWYNTLVILILSAHISQTRISWLHNGCRTDGVTGVYTTLQIVPRFKSLEIYTNVYICVCVSKLISQNRGFAIIFA